MPTDKTSHLATRAVHGGQQNQVAPNAAMPAIVTASSFSRQNLHDSPAYEYSRGANPTRHAYETCLAELEGGCGAVACASGVAATNLVLEMLPQNSHVLVMAGAYGGTFRLIEDYRSYTAGLTASFVDLNDAQALTDHLQANTRLIWIESPTNPLLRLVDLAKVTAFARQHGLLTCMDNTFNSPWNLQPMAYGVDLVMHSTSKYIGGHSDLIGGAVVAYHEHHLQRLKATVSATGAIQGPFDCYLALRGLKTLELRMARQSDNAQKLAEYLAGHPKVEAIYYPGLPNHPQHELCRQQMRTGGAVASVKLKAKGPQLNAFIESLRFFILADSLGGVESMINHSYSMSHNSMSHEQKAALGITENLFRLSPGIEDIHDLTADLEQSLNQI